MLQDCALSHFRRECACLNRRTKTRSSWTTRRRSTRIAPKNKVVRDAKAKWLDREAVAIVLIGLFVGALIGITLINHLDGTLAKGVEPRPDHGRLEVLTSSERLAPFTLITPEGSRGYVVKLVDANTGKTALTVFLEAGKIYETTAPLGAYKLRWASGREWVSEEALFGPLTEIQETTEPLVFGRGQSRADGHTIELEPQADGNLRSEHLRSGRF